MITISAKRLWYAAAFGILLSLSSASLMRRMVGPAHVFAAQDATPQPSVLQVEGAVPTPLVLTADDLAKLPRTTVTVPSDGGTDTYEGVLLYDVLVKAGWQSGHMTPGKGAAFCILATARDGFQAVFSIGEIDPQLAGQKVLIADKQNGFPLPDKFKPFRMVAPQDKRHARSIYSLTKIEVIKLPQ